MACGEALVSRGGSFDVKNIADAGSGTLNSTLDTQLKLIDNRLATVSRSLCIWAKPEHGDSGNEAQQLFWQAAMIAVATINTIAQIGIQQKRYQIANDYAKISEDEWGRFSGDYAPFEQAVLNEAGNTPVYVEDYPAARQRANTSTQLSFNEAQSRLSKFAKQYAVCIDPAIIDDLEHSQSISAVDGVNYNYRNEEWYALVMSDLRWNRRSQILNLGRGLTAQSASYAAQANTMLAGLSNIVNDGAQGAMTMLGYLNNARNTTYPAAFSGASGLMGASANATGADFIAMGQSRGE